MKALYTAAAATLVSLALTACTVHQTETPPAAGPSDLALSVRMEASPDTIGFDGGSQSAVRVSAFGPDGRPVSGLTLRVDMAVEGVVQDFGTLSARTVVTDTSGVARVTFTSPVLPPNADAGTCRGLPGTCVTIVATPTTTVGFGTVSPTFVSIRLVPLGVILPPATTPRPCMTISPAQPNANIPAMFTGGSDVGTTTVNCTTASSDIASFAWDFGDGGTAAGRQVNHTFANQGSFVVTLTETNDRGIAASTTQTVAIGASATPTARFTTSPSSPGINDQVFFNASGSTPGAGHSITSYSWDFGDGPSNGARGVTVTHIYQAAGTFVVTLTVQDEAGQTGITSQSITIGTGAPTARLLLQKTGGVNINADGCSSTAVGGAAIVDYTFTWNDGSAATSGAACNVTHAFSAPGTYTVSLTVRDNVSPPRTNTTTASVQVP